jgi:hypothetical protein
VPQLLSAFINTRWSGTSIKAVLSDHEGMGQKAYRNPADVYMDVYHAIEVLNVKVHVFVLLIFATLPDCSQNQTAVSDTLRLLSDF